MMSDLDAGFNEVARVYWIRLHEVASNILDNSYHLAEDAVQEGLLRAYKNLLQKREHNLKYYRKHLSKLRLRAWLYTIVRNKARDRISELRDEPIDTDGNSSFWQYVEGERLWISLVDERMERLETAQMASQLIELLSPMQVRVLKQKFFRSDGLDPYDVTDQQIAEEMGIPLNTVKSHKHRGYRQLRALLEEAENENISDD
jgi:RNA polymerase sigma-70 factor, ECF subfamily